MRTCPCSMSLRARSSERPGTCFDRCLSSRSPAASRGTVSFRGAMGGLNPLLTSRGGAAQALHELPQAVAFEGLVQQLHRAGLDELLGLVVEHAARHEAGAPRQLRRAALQLLEELHPG